MKWVGGEVEFDYVRLCLELGGIYWYGDRELKEWRIVTCFDIYISFLRFGWHLRRYALNIRLRSCLLTYYFFCFKYFSTTGGPLPSIWHTFPCQWPKEPIVLRSLRSTPLCCVITSFYVFQRVFCFQLYLSLLVKAVDIYRAKAHDRDMQFCVSWKSAIAAARYKCVGVLSRS